MAGARRPRAALRGAPLLAHAREIEQRLRALYPDAHCELDHRSPFELLAATILSAQCTDARVNSVTESLFSRIPSPGPMASSREGEIEEIIRPTGFFNAKARSLRGAARLLVERHGGEVPRTMESLRALPGVGRKTANVVLGNAFGAPDGVVVDTHVGRLARRLGWSRATNPEKVEMELNRLVPRPLWTWISHALILHGRALCVARRPRCGECPIGNLCPRTGVPGGGAKSRSTAPVAAKIAAAAPRAARKRA